MPDQQAGGERSSFAKMGEGYQRKVIQALMADGQFADQMSDVLDPRYFTLGYLETVARVIFAYRDRYKQFPSPELIGTIVKSDNETRDDAALVAQVAAFLQDAVDHPLNGDAKWVEENSLEFCKRQALVAALNTALDRIEERDYASIHGIMREALEKGAPRDAGHEYSGGFDERIAKSVRKPIATGWDTLDAVLNGGVEAGTLTTFIAPTGAGKSMFLVNVAASCIERGLDVLYATLEMAEFKIGLRVDSWFAGVPINDVPKNAAAVTAATSSRAKGRLIIKEWPTKRATVQTIRAHVQRLEMTKLFRPQVIIVDYADLLRGTLHGSNVEKRHELESIYEELRGLAQELGVAVFTADQTNRSGLNEEVVTLEQIAESYAKATVCDLIITIARRIEDKLQHTGRILVAKSRFGPDGMVFQILFNPATVKVRVLKQSEDITEALRTVRANDSKNFAHDLAEAYRARTEGRRQ